MNIYALHGFLGQPPDWDAFHTFLPPTVNFIPLNLNLFPPKNLISDSTLIIPEPQSDSILLGYSLGGRLALHALTQNQTQTKTQNSTHSPWKAAIFISTGPGLPNPALQKAQRLLDDQKWAQKFLNDPWDQLITEWNNQPIFKTKTNSTTATFPIRLESDYNRQWLADALINWSLANQADLRPQISLIPIPVLWITGELDTKYNALAKDLTFQHPLSKKVVASEASHRIPWELTQDLKKQILHFIGAVHDNPNTSNSYLEQYQKL